MARRLTPEARRAEIVDVAFTVIAEEGYRSLSLREVARRCDMSAPGLMHYFPDMPSLLQAVLSYRDESDIAAFTADDSDASVDDLIERALSYYAQRPDEVARFDALEREALDPNHPAHDYFVRRDERNFELMKPFVEREFADPEAVLRMLRIVVDGLRLSWIRDPQLDRLAEWRAIRGFVFAGCVRRTPAHADSGPALS